jgi:hypothetical protein
MVANSNPAAAVDDYHVTITPIVSTLRVYTSKDGYEHREPFLLVGTQLHTSDSEVMIQGIKGTISRASLLAICQKVHDDGNNTAQVKRPAGKQMPFGELIHEGKYEDTYFVDLRQLAADGLITPRAQ